MKRHKFPLLLVVVIFTAISITTFQQFRSSASIGPKTPVISRTENTSGPARLNKDSRGQQQETPTTTARVEAKKPGEEPKTAQANGQNDGFIALSKAEGTY